MKKIALVKLGGSIITDKSRPYTARPEIIKSLAKEIKKTWDRGHRFVIAHGGGSFSHTSASQYQTHEGIKKPADVFGLAVVQQDALKINRIVNEIFLAEGLPVLSFIPSSFTLARNRSLEDIFARPIIQALKIGALPLVFGDVILDKDLGCCIYSGEATLDNLIRPLLQAGFEIDKVIQCGDTDGVYDEEGKTIAKIGLQSFAEWKQLFGGSGATDVTGGMRHKIEESLKMAEMGIDSLIINGGKVDNLLRAILGKDAGGTLIAPK